MRTEAAVRRACSSLVLMLWLAGSLVGSADARPSRQQGDQVVREAGLELTRYGDATYQLSADGVLLEQLVAHLASLSGADFSVAPELLQAPVTIETDRLGLSGLLEQLRAFLEANLILASKRESDVSRVWLTPTSATAVAGGPNAPATTAGEGAQNPTLQGAPPPPQGMLPVPTGNEVRAAGYDPNVDMGEFIRNRTAAAAAANPSAAPGAEGQPPTTAEEPQAANAPPIPMDPNALETFFAGDSTTKTYHRLNCIQAMYLPAANKVWFKSRQEAIAAGYTPHDICLAR